MSGLCFAQTDSPWSAPFPPLPPLPFYRLCSATSQVLWSCPTSHIRSLLNCVLRLPNTASEFSKANMGSPGSRERCFRTCSRSLTAQGPNVSRDYDTFDVAFRTVPLRRHPGISGFRGSILGPYVPLSTLQPCHYWHSRMTRGQCGSLLLPLYETFIHYTFPVLTGALGASRNPDLFI